MTRHHTRIGLIADTHMPDRLRALPPALPELFHGVDLILHAGDVGELWVLDQLSAIAPVIAVHGNDDSADSQRELPYQQVIAVNGVRLLLWHSHYPDYTAEMASRRDDLISPARSLAQAQRAGAEIAVFGHWHIPFVHRQDGVCVVNPGALASGSVFSRQLIRSVAILEIAAPGQVEVRHINLDAPDQPFHPTVDWEAGFAANGARYEAPIVTPELVRAVAALRRHFSRDELLAVRPVFSPLAYAVWEGRAGAITTAQAYAALAEDPTLPADLKSRLLARLAEFQVAES